MKPHHLSKLSRRALHTARGFDPARARQTLDQLWLHVRTMDSASVQHGAEALVAALHAAGVTNARVVNLPSDGRASAAGWLAPVTWQVTEAHLELAGEPGATLASFAQTPQSIALFSPPTPDADWVEGGIVLVPPETETFSLQTLDPIASQLHGRFLLLPPGAASIEVNTFAAEHGALAVLTTSPGPIQNAARYLNYAVPLAADAACVPAFVLTPAVADELRARLIAAPELRLRARVRATRGDGVMPVVTGTVGSGGGLPILLCGHMDEPGANDNASGCAVGVEALRALQALTTDPSAGAQQRSIRFVFSTELRGLLFWINSQPRDAKYLLSLNLDMVGADPAREPCTLRIGTGFPHRPNFVHRLLDAAMALADRVVESPCARATGNCVLGDSAVVGIHDGESAVSIEQTTGPSYHTNADTPDRLISNRMLHWSGATTTALLHLLTRTNNDDLAELAANIRDEVIRTLSDGASHASIKARKLAIELETVERAAVPTSLYHGWTTAAQHYAAGVNRRTGRWPAVLAMEHITASTYDAAHAVSAHPPPITPFDPSWQQEADRFVPLALFRGPLCFEDQWHPEARQKLADTMGLEPGWGTENWVWRLASFFRGRQTLTEILNEMAGLGFHINPMQALHLTRLLVELEKVRLRPVLDAAILRDALTRAGVRRGQILVVHSGLSRFGYVPGGPETVVTVLRELLGPEGTLAMPTHSNSVLGATPYNPQKSRSNVGTISEYFRTLPGVLRSAHPTHSVAAQGPAAAALTQSKRLRLAPLDRHGFWGRLYDMDGDVLLLCPIRSATIFHAGETWAKLPQAPIIAHVSTSSGGRRTLTIPNAPWHVDYFESELAAPLLASGAMRQEQLGDAPLYFASARAMADISLEVNRRNPLCSIGKKGACTCFYCEALKKGLLTAHAGTQTTSPLGAVIKNKLLF